MRDVGLRRRKVGPARALAALSLLLAVGGCASLEHVGVPPLTSVVPLEAPKTLSIDSPASLEAKRLAATSWQNSLRRARFRARAPTR